MRCMMHGEKAQKTYTFAITPWTDALPTTTLQTSHLGTPLTLYHRNTYLPTYVATSLHVGTRLHHPSLPPAPLTTPFPFPSLFPTETSHTYLSTYITAYVDSSHAQLPTLKYIYIYIHIYTPPVPSLPQLLPQTLLQATSSHAPTRPHTCATIPTLDASPGSARDGYPGREGWVDAWRS